MQESLTIVLGKLMADEEFSVRLLSKRSGVSKETLTNWLNRGQIPRSWRGLIRVADALALSEKKTDQLLMAANKPPLSELRRTVSEKGKPADIALLARWQPIVRGAAAAVLHRQ